MPAPAHPCTPGPRPPALAALLLAALLVPGCGGECGLEACTEQYVQGEKVVVEGPTVAYCALTQQYSECTNALAGACRGDLTFHFTVEVLVERLARHNCSAVLAGAGPLPTPGSGDPSSDRDEDVCQYRGPTRPAHCGLFGDPHLKTFNGEYMTCRVGGAWPLLNTPHLAIQVTNQPVGPDSQATATTKVTVIIKGSNDCGPERTYEASSEGLPKAFVDGTTWAGGSIERPHTRVEELRSSQHVLITISHVNATVALRKINRYLTVLVTLPESLLGEGGEEMQLCVQGCPAQERLDHPPAHSPPLITHPAMPKQQATRLCQEYNVTDYYLDSCIFDLVATGDKSFREAARLAQYDLWHHDPAGALRLLQNCTKHPCIWEVSSAAPQPRQPLLVAALVALLVLSLTVQEGR